MFKEGLPAKFENSKDKPSLKIVDDLLNEAYLKDYVTNLRKVAITRNVSVVLITHKLFHQGRYCCDITLNAKCIVVLKNARDMKQFYHLARQVYPEDSDGIFQAYLNATDLPHGYLLLELS